VGAQAGLTWKSVNLTLLAYNRSKFGVLITLLPWHAKSPYPWSSAMIKTMFGRSVDLSEVVA